MKNTKTLFIAGIVALAVLGGSLGGLNLHWTRQPSFPVYAYVVDLVGLWLFSMLLIKVRRLKSRMTDEFALTKTRYATQTGFIIGLVLFLLTNPWPIFFPDSYHAFIAWTGSAEDAFAMGRVFGFAPFVIGVLIGQVFAWKKYS